jgi:hypothetical protein
MRRQMLKIEGVVKIKAVDFYNRQRKHDGRLFSLIIPASRTVQGEIPEKILGWSCERESIKEYYS